MGTIETRLYVFNEDMDINGTVTMEGALEKVTKYLCDLKFSKVVKEKVRKVEDKLLKK